MTTRKSTAATATAATTVPLSEVATLDAALRGQVAAITNSATFTNFSTGSDGFRATGKAVNAEGHRYQVSVMLVRIGSKDCKAV